MKILNSLLFYVIAIAYIIIGMVLFSLLFVLTVAFDRNRVALHVFSRYWARSLYALNPQWRFRIEGRENIDPKGVYVITVNHQSMLDIPLLYVIPRLVFKWVSKSEVYKIPIFGAVLWMHGDIAIKRGSGSAYKVLSQKGNDYLGRGVSIIIFPEGTRSHDGEIHRFKEGAFSLAKSAGVGILPCVIDGTHGILDGWKFNRVNFTVRILPPLSADYVAGVHAADLAQEVMNMTNSELKEIRSKGVKRDR